MNDGQIQAIVDSVYRLVFAAERIADSLERVTEPRTATRPSEDWTGHARVELLGHRSYLGRIREVQRYGSQLVEVQELLASGEYGETHTFGGKSVYEIREVSLEEALKSLRPEKSLNCWTCGTRIRKLQWGDPEYADPPRETCDECKTDCRKCAHRRERDYNYYCGKSLHRARGMACDGFEQQTPATQPSPADDDLPFDGTHPGDFIAGEIHGPERCTGGGDPHDWMKVECTNDDTDPRFKHPANDEYEEWLQCRNCDAWAEIVAPDEDDDEEQSDREHETGVDQARYDAEHVINGGRDEV